MGNIITFKNIDKSFFGVHALDDINFSIKKGEVHAIIGENGAGKSTLIKILSGILQPDKGEIIFRDKSVHLSSPIISKSLGIETVYQELQLCENLNVSENIFLGREYRKRFLRLNWKKMQKETIEALREYGLKLNVGTFLGTLSAAEMQIIEIIRAIKFNTEVLILDEPTSSLTVNETEILFDTLLKLRNKGITIIFISHRLDEVFKISDRITILRNGKYLGTYQKDEITRNEVVNLIAGKDLIEELQYAKTKSKAHENSTALEVKNLSLHKLIKDVSFKLYKSEILGFYGLQGAGRTELMQAIYGIHRIKTGTIKINGVIKSIKNVNDALKNGIGMVPEDRKYSGILPKLNVKENLIIMHKKKISFFGFLQNSRIYKIINTFIDNFSIKISNLGQLIESLSGGNQQKVLIARVLSTHPSILIMDEPTRGIDVGAKIEIFKMLRKLSKEQSISIIFVSSELQEVISECDRVMVMRNGRIAGEVKDSDINEKKILHYAFNG